jgi:hypothetical protein
VVVQNRIIGDEFRGLVLLLLALEQFDLHLVAPDFVLPVGIDVRVEYGQAIDISDIGWDPSEVLDLLLIGNSLLEDGLPLALQFAEQEEDKLVQILDL